MNDLDEIIEYLERMYSEMTVGDMPDSEGTCKDIAKYVTYLKGLKHDNEEKEHIFSENYPVTFEDKGLRAFIQENFSAYFKDITLTDEELDQFKRHLEASLGDWISENWRDFINNRGD